ncbi:helix-turn-helix domain-containing protein [Thermococcus thioreducens]|uniref:DNA binding domain-containing protein, excisionase family n=1 Tax=Thermococcus thioreducens TaxID=277988 RepID=A0A0Q2XPB8_9EURY|nr:helix-turn-helix domain-containing protein [Thermococcus thioreducens]ASJ12401.1 hypothetical protein A3L14_05620 [Thermococcus thioreducens]KQH83132.1 hypothetical protein AMR53_02625 [Thermococcus thioreducens]SEV91484.1 DNA binding domain-containing protein, excisionase family [Thermococcus thioreducens]
MATPRPEGPYYSPREVARELDIDIFRLYTLIEKRKVNALKTRYKKCMYYWIHKDEVKRLKKMMGSKDCYTTGEVAKILNVTRNTVYEWIRRGKIRAVQPSFHKHWRIPKEVVDMLLEARQLPPEQLYTESQLVEVLGIPRRRVGRIVDLILSGEIQGVAVGKRWYIPKSELEKAKEILREEYGEKVLHNSRIY